MPSRASGGFVRQDQDAVPFFLATGLLISAPLLLLLALGRRADSVLPRVREWMNANSWVVSEIVIVFFFVTELKNAISS